MVPNTNKAGEEPLYLVHGTDVSLDRWVWQSCYENEKLGDTSIVRHWLLRLVVYKWQPRGLYSVEHGVFVEVKWNMKLKNDRYTNYEVL